MKHHCDVSISIVSSGCDMLRMDRHFFCQRLTALRLTNTKFVK